LKNWLKKTGELRLRKMEELAQENGGIGYRILKNWLKKTGEFRNEVLTPDPGTASRNF
jgi:hypothetical protein